MTRQNKKVWGMMDSDGCLLSFVEGTVVSFETKKDAEEYNEDYKKERPELNFTVCELTVSKK